MATGNGHHGASHKRAQAKARSLDVYKALPLLRDTAPGAADKGASASTDASKGEIIYTYMNDDDHEVKLSQKDVEHGFLGSQKASKRLNIPTPVCGEVADYETYARKLTEQPASYVRGIGQPLRHASSVPSALRGGAGGAPLSARASAHVDAAEEEGGLEYVLSVEDERWLAEDLPRLVQRKLTAPSSSTQPRLQNEGPTATGRKRGGSHKRKHADVVSQPPPPPQGGNISSTAAAEPPSKVAKTIGATSINGGSRNGYESSAAAAGNNSNAALGEGADEAEALTNTKAAPAPVDPSSVAYAALITGATFEALVDALEHASYFEGATISAKRAGAALLCDEPPIRGGVGNKEGRFTGTPEQAAVLGPLCHSYWVEKRNRIGKSVLRRYWPKTAPTDTNPHCVFRPREKERYKLRKHRRNDVDAFRKLQLLRRDFVQAFDLVKLVERREVVKRLALDATRGHLRRDLDALGSKHNATPLPADSEFADEPRDYAVKKLLSVVDEDKKSGARAAASATRTAAAAPSEGGEKKKNCLAAAEAAARGESSPAPAATSKKQPLEAGAGAKRSAEWKALVAALRERLAGVAVQTADPEASEAGGGAGAGQRGPGGARGTAGSAGAMMGPGQPPGGPGGALSSAAASASASASASAAARKQQRHRKKAKKYDGDGALIAEGPSSSTIKRSGDAGKPPDHSKPCIPAKGFMDQEWWGRADLRFGAAAEPDAEPLAPWVASMLSPRVTMLLEPQRPLAISIPATTTSSIAVGPHQGEGPPGAPLPAAANGAAPPTLTVAANMGNTTEAPPLGTAPLAAAQRAPPAGAEAEAFFPAGAATSLKTDEATEAAAAEESPAAPFERSVRRRSRACRLGRVAIERYSSYRVRRPVPVSRHGPPAPPVPPPPPRPVGGLVTYVSRAAPRRWATHADESIVEQRRRHRVVPEDEARATRFARALQLELLDRASSDDLASDDDDDDDNDSLDNFMQIDASAESAVAVTPCAAAAAAAAAATAVAPPPPPPPPPTGGGDAAPAPAAPDSLMMGQAGAAAPCSPPATIVPPHPRTFWRLVEDGVDRALAAAVPVRRPRTTISAARFAEICALSDSEDEDLQALDADPVNHQHPGAPRVKFAIHV